MESSRPLGFWGIAWKTLVGLLIASPFFASGVLAMMYGQFEAWAPTTMLAAGVLLFAGTLYFGVARSAPIPDLEEDEYLLVLRHPSMKPAFAQIIGSLPFFVISGYLLEFTYLPYIWPLIPYFTGLFLYFRGIARFWINHLTTYYVTSEYIVHTYQFFPGVEKGSGTIPVEEAVNYIGKDRSFFQVLTGRGRVTVHSSVHKVDMQDIDNPREVERIVQRAKQATRR